MITWICIALLLYFTYYTISYGVIVWKEGKKFAAVCISILGIAIIVIPLIERYLENQ